MSEKGMILAKYTGLLCGVKVLQHQGDKVRVKVVDEKRPKWVDLSSGSYKLFNDTEEAIQWIEALNDESESHMREYFENGCLCILRDKTLEKAPACMSNEDAVKLYMDNCKCSRHPEHGPRKG
ncbi:hypothetical protein VL2_gp025 [Pseudomonas phage vB_PaeM_VL12]|nr:hypothetical protein VL2_gp025 [Pseudomonas phage vB_PaeM_VL12]